MKHYFLYFVAMWAIHLINSSINYSLNIFGVNPNWLMQPSINLIFGIPLTLLGFLSHPFLHGSNAHIINNSLAYIPLGLLVAATENFRTKFWRIAIICGVMSWLLVVFGSRGGAFPMMVGASGVIYGFIGYLLASSIHKFCFVNVLFSVACWVHLP